MIEVFKTNVRNTIQATKLIALLQQQFPGTRINFDLEDCDNILRIEGKNVSPGNVMLLMNEHGYRCMMLD